MIFMCTLNFKRPKKLFSVTDGGSKRTQLWGLILMNTPVSLSGETIASISDAVLFTQPLS